MRQINYIAVHCTGASQKQTVESIKAYWKNMLGWKSPGYHVIVRPDGSAVELLPIESVSNGVAGYNSQTINICYIGGVDYKLRPVDNRTPEQKETILKYLHKWRAQFPNAKIQGHRDFPKVKKACPSFDAKSEYASI